MTFEEQLRLLPRYLVARPPREARYQVPVQVDPYRRLLMPPALLSWPYPGPRREACFRFAWGGRPYPPGVGPRPLVLLPRPAIDPDRVRWFEPVSLPRAPLPFVTSGTAFELLRTNQLAPGAAMLRKVATWLHVAFLAEGQPVGTPFVTGQDTDPGTFAVDHPTLAGSLQFAWVLVGDPSDGPEPLFIGNPGAIPRAHALDGLPWSWTDLRYSWGSRYTETHTIIVPPETRLRLYVVLVTTGATTPADYSVRAGGLLAGALQNSSPAAITSIQDWIS